MPSEISDSILQHFQRVRDDTGISVSLQMKMFENGYRIEKFGEHGNKMVEINDG